MQGECIAEVIESKNTSFKVGELVSGGFGWVSHAISSGRGLRKIPRSNIPEQTSLGVLGMPGHTAWVGLNKIATASSGETIVVSAASGAVGSLVGQLAKKKGLRVIGVAGSDQKCAYVTKELGYDACINHRSVSSVGEFREMISSYCPEGIDIYFENVGGKVWQAVTPLLNMFSRVAVCGMISHYNATSLPDGPNRVPELMFKILTHRVTLRGFIVRDYDDQLEDFLSDTSRWIKEGKIKYREDITNGLEQAPRALIGLLKGENFGKLCIKVSPDTAN